MVMVRSKRSKFRDRKGSTLALYAVMLTGLLGSMALAIDVGMAFDAHAEAQRVADLSALAGASAFMEMSGLTAEAEAESRAMAYATTNYVHGAMVEPAEVAIDPDWGTKEVEVIITRQDIPAWFARFLGLINLDVQARAVAKVSDGGTANQCLLPFSPPDIWHEGDTDENGNHLPDFEEEWDFDDFGEDGGSGDDYYVPWNGQPGDNAGTGYGSMHRGGDAGMMLYIKAGPPGVGGDNPGGGGGELDEPQGPGNFLSWNMPQGEDCVVQHGGGEPWVEENIRTCNQCPIGIGTDYEYITEPGNMRSLMDDLQWLIDSEQDQAGFTTSWSDACDCVVANVEGVDIRDSPRVRPVAFRDPGIDVQGANVPISFTNIAWMYIDWVDVDGHTAGARFIGKVSGGDEGPGTGPLVQYLRLVE